MNELLIVLESVEWPSTGLGNQELSLFGRSGRACLQNDSLSKAVGPLGGKLPPLLCPAAVLEGATSSGGSAQVLIPAPALPHPHLFGFGFQASPTGPPCPVAPVHSQAASPGYG